MARLNWRTITVNVILLVAGALISAVSVIIFFAPFQIAPGGVSGLAVILNHLNPTLPIGLMVLIGNIPIQLLGYRMLGGWKVVASTVFFVVVYSLGIDLLTPYLSTVDVGDNSLLAALFGGIIGGVGGGLVFGWEGALYAMVALFVGGVASDYVLEGPSVIRTATIVTDHPQEVAQAILGEMGRGVTSWPVQGMFTEQPHTVLFVTLARPQVNALRRLVFSVDSDAFVVIGQGHVAYGEGFKRLKR